MATGEEILQKTEQYIATTDTFISKVGDLVKNVSELVVSSKKAKKQEQVTIQSRDFVKKKDKLDEVRTGILNSNKWLEKIFKFRSKVSEGIGNVLDFLKSPLGIGLAGLAALLLASEPVRKAVGELFLKSWDLVKDKIWPFFTDIIGKGWDFFVKKGMPFIGDIISGAWFMIKNDLLKPIGDWFSNTIKVPIESWLRDRIDDVRVQVNKLLPKNLKVPKFTDEQVKKNAEKTYENMRGWNPKGVAELDKWFEKRFKDKRKLSESDDFEASGNVLEHKNLRETVEQLANTEPILLDKLANINKSFRQVFGKDIPLNSANRSWEVQKRWRNSWEKNPELWHGGVNKPEDSAHVTQQGEKYSGAIDVGTKGMSTKEYEFFIKELEKQGLWQPYGKKEPWHIELKKMNQNLEQNNKANLPEKMIENLEKVKLQTSLDDSSLEKLGDILKVAMKDMIPKSPIAPSANLQFNTWG